MRRTTRLLILETVEEVGFPTRHSTRDTTIDTTAEELPSHTRIPLPPAHAALAKRLARWEREGR